MYSVVLKHRITSKTHFVLQHDHGYAGGVLLNGVNKNAEWYGINTHLYYDLTSELSVGIRGEWFRDRDGFRVFSPSRVSAPRITRDSATRWGTATRQQHQYACRLLRGYGRCELEGGKDAEA